MFGNRTILLLPSNQRQLDCNIVGEAAFSHVLCHTLSFLGLRWEYFMDITQ